MEIPKSLQTTWTNVSQDKNINKADYDLLVKAAAPTGKDEELDNSEVEFLGKLKSELEKNGGTKGSVPVEGLSFSESTPPKVIKEADIGDVPETLVQAWGSAIEDGKIDADDYRALMEVASPNWSDSELDDKEKAFLGNLQALLKSTGQDLNIQKKTQETQVKTQPEQSEESKDNETKVETKDSPKPIPEVNTETDDSLKSLNEVNNILDALGDDPDFAPLRGIVNQRLSNSSAAKKFSNDVNQIINSIEPSKPSSVNEGKSRLKTLYDGLPAGVKANPEITNLYTHAMGTLDSQVNASKNKPKNPSKPKVNNNSAQNINVPKSLQATWNKVAADGKIDKNEYSQLLKAASPTGSDDELDKEEINFLGDLKQKVNNEKGIYSFVDEPEVTQEENESFVSPLVDLGEPPETLKSKIDELLQKGNITNDDFNELVKLASPSGKDQDFDDQEKEYLFKLKAKVEASGGNLQLAPSKTNEPTVQTNKKPILLNWPGYTAQTKGALKTAFGTKVSGGNMPILKGSEGLKIAKTFGVQNIRQLQELVKAKVDGQFGPETFFKAKVFIANEMNKPNADKAKLESMLNSLGVDEEVETMKSNIGAVSNPTSGTEENNEENMSTSSTGNESLKASDDGVPETLKATWNKVTADGKLTKADFDLLMKAASPTKKNSEFDDSELEFLASVKDMFDKNKVDVLEVNKPEASSKTTKKTETQQTSDDGVPETLKATWNKVTADGKLTKADFDLLMKAASPNKKNSEFDDSELEFLASVKDMFDKNKVDVLEVNKPEASSKTTKKTETQQTSDNGVPETLKATWNKVTADGKLTKADFDLLMKAASPNKKNSEFDDSELEFLASIKDMFDKNKVDVLEVNKPEASSKTTKKTETQAPTQKTNTASISAKNFNPPETLKTAWSKAISDGKVNDADFDLLMKAAAPNKKNVEFENEEIEFLADLREKIKASGGTLNISK